MKFWGEKFILMTKSAKVPNTSALSAAITRIPFSPELDERAGVIVFQTLRVTPGVGVPYILGRVTRSARPKRCRSKFVNSIADAEEETKLFFFFSARVSDDSLVYIVRGGRTRPEWPEKGGPRVPSRPEDTDGNRSAVCSRLGPRDRGGRSVRERRTVARLQNTHKVRIR